MSDFFGFLFFISIILLIIGLVRPSVFQKLFKGRILDRKFILKIFGFSALALFILIGLTAEPVLQEESIPVSNNQALEEKVLVENVTAVNETSPAVTTLSHAPTQTLYPVTQVVDGDTIKVQINGQTETIRLIGLDTPETVDPRKVVQCFGQEASNKAKELLIGKQVSLEADITQGERDKYDRLLRYAYLKDGTYHWLLDYGNPFFDDDGKFLGYIGSCYDNEKNKKCQSEIEKLNSFMLDRESKMIALKEEIKKLKEKK